MDFINDLCLVFALFIVSVSAHGANVFNPTLEVCCDGDIRPKQFGNATECCGSNIYDVYKHMCCTSGGGIMNDDNDLRILPFEFDIRDRQPTWKLNISNYADLRCCGNKTLDSTDHVCCDGKIMDRLFPNSGCCGSKIYDKDRFECCSGSGLNAVVTRRNKDNVSSCCGSRGFNRRRQICCEGNIYRNHGSLTNCCGNKPFTIGQEICCGGVISNDPFGLLGCCGYNGTYEIHSDICCDGVKLFDRFRNKACCGSSSYSPKTQTCCGGIIVPKDDENAARNCCGSKSYNPSKSICCEGSVVDIPLHDQRQSFFSCCGKKLYNQRDELCCDFGSIRKLTSSETSCCGTGTFEKINEICCGGVVLAKDVNSEDRLNTKDSPDQKTVKKCCKNKVVDIPHGYQLCC